MVHFLTQQSVQKARELLKNQDVDSLRYASLQLRMAIENLFYELLPLYKEELPDDIVSKWQPQQILDGLLQCDPLVANGGQIGFGPLDASRSDGATEFAFVKEIKQPNKRLLKDHYHRLGFYLHAAVDMSPPDPVKWRTALEKAVEVLSPFDGNQVLCNLRTLEKIVCECCGRTIAKNRRAIEQSWEMRCPDPKCNAIYEVKIGEGLFEWQLKIGLYACPYCDLENTFSLGLLKDGLELKCKGCEKRIALRSSYEVVPLDGSPEKTP